MDPTRQMEIDDTDSRDRRAEQFVHGPRGAESAIAALMKPAAASSEY
jgi:hypothetical protein